MGELVGNDARQFIARKHVQQAGRDGHRGMRGVSPGRERVRLRVVHEIDTRHGQSSAIGEPGHHVNQFRRRMLVDLLGAVDRQHHPVAIPVGKEIHRSGEQEGDQGAVRSTDQVADPHEQGGQPGE